MDWLDLLAVLGTLKSLLQHSAFFTFQLSHPYMTTGKTIALTRQTFADKVMSLLFNMLSRLVIAFLLRSNHLLTSWLQSPSAVILEPRNIKSATVSRPQKLYISGFPILKQKSNILIFTTLPFLQMNRSTISEVHGISNNDNDYSFWKIPLLQAPF